MCKLGLVFPGQGAQYVGMGSDLHREYAEVRDVFRRAQEVLGVDVAALCFEGPQETLDLTVNTQIAILTLEMAIFNVFEPQLPLAPSVLAGHSLGEYSALYAAGAIDFADILSLVRARANHHQNAVPLGTGAMAAMIGLPQEEAARICADLCGDGQVVGVAIHNAPNQVVISGHATAVDQAVALAKGQTAVQAVRLPISVPCHCSLLMDAAEQFRGDLERTPIGAFRFPVIPNCDPEVFHSREHTRDLLMRQITSPVRWRETVERMATLGIDTIVEVGPKKTLAGLIKRIDRRIRVLNVNDVESLQKTVAALTIS